MMSHHYIPVEEVLHGLCIDDVGTRVCEDMVRVMKNDQGDTQVDIAVVVPPIEKVNTSRLFESLKHLMVSQENGNMLPFLDIQTKINSGFSETTPRDVFLVTYVVNSNGELLLEELTLSQAIASMIDYKEYEVWQGNHAIVDALMLVLGTKPEIERHVTRRLRESFPLSASLGYLTTLMISSLFNSTCRDASKKNKARIPFIKRPNIQNGNTSFPVGIGLAKFNACLRDPCSYINAANLYHYLCGEKTLPFTKTDLRKIVPINTKYKKGIQKNKNAFCYQ